MLKGFKDFLMRGNVIDLAVAVIIGTAFTAVVTAIVTNLIQPLIAAIGGSNVGGLSWTIVAGNAKSTIDFAAIITAAINFVLIAAIVYFLIVLPVKTIQERRKRGEEVGPAEPTDVELLTEIRDLLRPQQPVGRGANPGGGYFQGGQPGQMPPGGPNHPGGPGPAGPPPGPRSW